MQGRGSVKIGGVRGGTASQSTPICQNRPREPAAISRDLASFTKRRVQGVHIAFPEDGSRLAQVAQQPRPPPHARGRMRRLGSLRRTARPRRATPPPVQNGNAVSSIVAATPPMDAKASIRKRIAAEPQEVWSARRDERAHAAGDEAVEELAPVDLRLRERDGHPQHAPPADGRIVSVGHDADRSEDGGVADDPVDAHLLVPGVENEISRLRECAGARVRHASSSPSSLLVALLTWVADMPSIPISASTSSTSRVETPLRCILAAAAMTACVQRRPR